MDALPVHDSATFRRRFGLNFGLLLSRFGCKESGFGRVKEVALMFDMSTTGAQKWLSGVSLPDMAKLPEICDKLHCTLDELIYGPDSPEVTERLARCVEDMHSVRVYSNSHDRSAFVSKEFFDPTWWGAGLSALHIEDNTMEPFVMAGEYVLFTRATPPERLTGVFVLFNNGTYVVRRLQETMEQSINLLCENKRYAPEVVPASRFRFAGPELALVESNFVTVIGRVTGRVLRR